MVRFQTFFLFLMISLLIVIQADFSVLPLSAQSAPEKDICGTVCCCGENICRCVESVPELESSSPSVFFESPNCNPFKKQVALNVSRHPMILVSLDGLRVPWNIVAGVSEKEGLKEFHVNFTILRPPRA
ncbi:MAG: hypothetical protein ACI9BD_000417 [Candidatus Marinamargulisbacteria bacterium]